MELKSSYFSLEMIQKISEEVKRLEEEKDIKNYIWKYYEIESKNINRIEYFVNYSPFLKKISEDLCPENYVLMKDKINFKYPFGEEFKAHQDIAAGWGKYGNKHLTYTIPLVDTDEKNGCLYFADIGVSSILTEERSDLSDDIVPPEKYSPVSTKKGDIIIFDSYIPHKSFINKSEDSRIILYFTYVEKPESSEVYEKYHKDKFENVPPDIYKKAGEQYRNGNSFTLRTY